MNEKKDRDYKPHGIISRQQIKPPTEKFSRRSKRYSGQDEKPDTKILKQEDCKDCKEECDSDPEINNKQSVNKKSLDLEKDNSKELKKLQFYGAGPKMAGFNTKENPKKGNKTRGVKLTYDFDPVSREGNFFYSLFQDNFSFNCDNYLNEFSIFSWPNTYVTIVGGVTTKKICSYAMVVTTVITHSVYSHR